MPACPWAPPLIQRATRHRCAHRAPPFLSSCQWGSRMGNGVVQFLPAVALFTPSFHLPSASGMRSVVGWHPLRWAALLGLVGEDMARLLQGSRHAPLWCTSCHFQAAGICWVGPWVGSKDWLHLTNSTVLLGTILYPYVLHEEMPVHDNTRKKVTQTL